MLVPAEVQLVDVHVQGLKVLRLSIQDVVVQIAPIVHAEVLWQAGEAGVQHLKDSAAVADD